MVKLHICCLTFPTINQQRFWWFTSSASSTKSASSSPVTAVPSRSQQWRLKAGWSFPAITNNKHVQFKVLKKVAKFLAQVLIFLVLYILMYIVFRSFWARTISIFFVIQAWPCPVATYKLSNLLSIVPSISTEWFTLRFHQNIKTGKSQKWSVKKLGKSPNSMRTPCFLRQMVRCFWIFIPRRGQWWSMPRGQVPNFRLLLIQYLMAAFLVITRYYMLLPFFAGSLLCFLSWISFFGG